MNFRDKTKQVWAKSFPVVDARLYVLNVFARTSIGESAVKRVKWPLQPRHIRSCSRHYVEDALCQNTLDIVFAI